MLECIIWNDAFPKNEFKFPWDIADCVMSGNRPNTIEYVEIPDLKSLIEMCWFQQPKERLTIDYVVSMLETQLIKLNQ